MNHPSPVASRKEAAARRVLAALAMVVLAAGAVRAQSTVFSYDNLIQRAKDLSRKAFKPSEAVIPDSLRQLDYDQLRDIRFRPEHALWRNQGPRFEIQFFHLGFLYTEPVRVYVVEKDKVAEVRFQTAFFDYGKNRFEEPLPEGLGFAGFRIHYPLQRPDYFDEVAVFLGASYFRVLGKDQVYGISARGLAVDTALPTGEEFPRFSEFWLVKPDPEEDEMTIYALLDSPSVVGAYAFTIQPGRDTIVDTDCHLFPRKEIQKLGIAPLTSMFLFAENKTRYFADFRPEVHDSDGLLVGAANGEWLWRPLVNPVGTHRVNRYMANDAVGFGLLQRDRDYRSYLDLESHFERRPSLWIEPVGNWGKGSVELVEIPSDNETNDNVVTFWVPDAPVQPRRELHYRYRIHAVLDDLKWPPLARAQATRIHPGYLGATARFLIEFHGPWLPDLEAEAEVTADVSASRGQIRNLVTQKNPMTSGWRVFFDLDVGPGDPIQLRSFLRLGARVLSETWQYEWVTQ